MDRKIIVGKIISVFGIKGEVKIISFCEKPEDIQKYPLFNKVNQQIILKINKKSAKKTKGGETIFNTAIEGVQDRNEAEKMVNVELFTDRKNFAKLKKNEFYLADLIGLKVVNDKYEKIGQVLNVADYGAGTLIEVEFLQEDLNAKLQKIDNFPFKDKIFPEIDIEEGFIRMEMPEIL